MGGEVLELESERLLREGWEEAKAEGDRMRLEKIVKTLKKKGYDNAQISDMIGVSIEEVEALKIE